MFLGVLYLWLHRGFPISDFRAGGRNTAEIVAGAAKTVSRSETGAGDGGEVVQLKLPSEPSN